MSCFVTNGHASNALNLAHWFLLISCART